MISPFLACARRALLGLAALALTAAAAAPAVAEPALWAIRDKDSTIYLFGTVHVLKPDTAWRTPKIAQAFESSGALVMEIQQPDDPATLRPLVSQYGLDPTAPLSGKLTPADLARLQAAAASLGLPAAGLEPMRPWLAALSLSLVPVLKAGYDPKSGVELVLTAQAKAAGKPITAFETAEQQIRFFSDMPPAAELALLTSTLDEVGEGPARIDAMVTAWAAGDQAALEAEFVAEMKGKYPGLYERLIAGRNRDWARQLKTRLAGSGVSFVAVGAGHLVGPDSVQAQLAKLGIAAERVE
ncbi:MAG: GumN family protein [Caulobacter sp.]|nr:GumN family protein [Caulobacter sp.]